MMSGDIKTAMIFSKHRIISTKCLESKKNSIPRGKLSGLLLGTEIGKSVQNCLKSVYPINVAYYWTNSSVVFAWVNNGKHNLEPYVQTRVYKIREAMTKEQLMLVPSKDNPADIATRGLSLYKLAKPDLWFHEPKYLILSEHDWPRLNVGDKFIDTLNCNSNKVDTNITSVSAKEDVETTFTCVNAAYSNHCVSNVIDTCKYSKLEKLLRITVWVVRFKNKMMNLQNKNTNEAWAEELVGDEINASKKIWIGESQRILCETKEIDNPKNQLGLYLDNAGLWRCRGRIGNADLPIDTKHP